MDWSENGILSDWLDKNNMGIYHEQWFCSDETHGMGYGDKGAMPGEKENPSRYHRVEPDGFEYQDDLLNKAIKYNNPDKYGKYYLTPHPVSLQPWAPFLPGGVLNPYGWKWAPSHNCQAWAEDILNYINNQ